VELQLIEDEATRRDDEERRRLASLPDRETFMLCDVVVTKLVFDVKDREDLEPFDDSEEEMEAEDDDDNDEPDSIS
jgi:hypothetical protein